MEPPFLQHTRKTMVRLGTTSPFNYGEIHNSISENDDLFMPIQGSVWEVAQINLFRSQ